MTKAIRQSCIMAGEMVVCGATWAYLELPNAFGKLKAGFGKLCGAKPGNPLATWLRRSALEGPLQSEGAGKSVTGSEIGKAGPCGNLQAET